MLPALLLLPSLLGAVLAGPVQGPPECARGSALWCQDLQAAVRCGAVGHCRHAVWGKPAARTLPCDVCLDVVAAASNGLNPNATESDILALVNKTCEWLPSQESSARCKETVDAHGSTILSMLSGGPGGAPAQLCAALTLCQPLQRLPAAPGLLSEDGPSEHDPSEDDPSEQDPSEDGPSEAAVPFTAAEPLSFHLPPVPEDTACQDCVQLVGRLQDAVGSNLSSLAEATSQEQCKSLGPGLAPLCQTYILRFLTPAEQTLRLVLPEETCEQGGFCEGLRGPAGAEDGLPFLEPLSPGLASGVQMQAGVTCEVCLEVIQELDQWLVSNSTEALIRRALERVCAVMPHTITQQCVAMVDAYSASLVQFVTRVPPDRVCKAVRLCHRSRYARAVRRPHSSTPSPLLDRDGQGSFCNGCKRLLGVSTHNLERKSTRLGILRAFKGGCGILPLPYLIQCHRFVDEYEPVLVATLMEMMDPTALCTRVGACHTATTTLLGTDQCVMGPSFWCASQEAAELCEAVDHCQRHIWKLTPFHA